MTTKITIPTLNNFHSKPKTKKINVDKFKVLAKKVKGYLEEEEKKLQEQDEYNKKFRLSFGN